MPVSLQLENADRKKRKITTEIFGIWLCIIKKSATVRLL